MATTDELRSAQDEFNAAFNEPEPERREVSEDEAFGLTPEAGAENGTSDTGEPEAVATVDMDAAAEQAGGPADTEAGTDADANAAAAADEANAAPAGDDAAAADGAPADEATPPVEAAAEPADQPTDPKELQRMKSWEGRLKAREEELRRREEGLKGREAAGAATVDAAGGETSDTERGDGAQPGAEAAEAAEQLADAVQSGEITPERALKMLEEDFGPEFVQALTVVLGAKAGEAASRSVDERLGDVNKTVDALIADIVDDKQRAHFETIADKHPDFIEVADSEGFTQYIESLPEADQAKAKQVAEGGSARQIVKLLDGYKDWSAKQGAADEPAPEPTKPAISDAAADAAEGVRSGGMRLPDAPEKSDDYESAWANF